MGKGINTGHDQEPADGRLEIIAAQEKKICAGFSSLFIAQTKRKECEERASIGLP